MEMPGTIGLLYLIMAGVFGWVLQVSYATAIKLDSPGNALLFANSNIFLSLIGDRVVFGNPITIPKVVGSIFMISSLIAITRLRKN